MEPVVAGCGQGGIEELAKFVDDSKVQWGLVDFHFGSGSLKKSKVVFLIVYGEKCKPSLRGHLMEFTSQVKDYVTMDQTVDPSCVTPPATPPATPERVAKSLATKSLESGAVSARRSICSTSMEIMVRSREEVTLENILPRLQRFATADSAEYSVSCVIDVYREKVQRDRKRYAEELAEKVKAAKAALDSSPHSRRRPGHESTRIFQVGRDALRAVSEPAGAWNWVLLRPCDQTIAGGGAGSVDEMRAFLEDQRLSVLYGLLRLSFGTGRLRRMRFVFVIAKGAGANVSSVTTMREKRSSWRADIVAMRQCNYDWQLNYAEECTLENIVDRISQHGKTVVDDEIDQDTGKKCTFSVQAARDALKEELQASAAANNPGGGTPDGRSASNEASEMIQHTNVQEIVRLIHTDSPLNWALFEPQPGWAKEKAPALPVASHFKKPSKREYIHLVKEKKMTSAVGRTTSDGIIESDGEEEVSSKMSSPARLSSLSPATDMSSPAADGFRPPPTASARAGLRPLPELSDDTFDRKISLTDWIDAPVEPPHSPKSPTSPQSQKSDTARKGFRQTARKCFFRK